MFETPYKDSCDKTVNPGTSNSDKETGFASTPGRTGGLLKEVIRDTNMTPKTPGWISPDSDTHFKW